MDESRSSRERTGRVFGQKWRGGFENMMQLLTCDTREIITRHPADCNMLDEHVLLQAGVAAGTDASNASTQCDASDMPPLQMLLPPSVPAAATANPRGMTVYLTPDDHLYSANDTIEVLWQDHSGGSYQWWPATVLQVTHEDDGSVLHELNYTSWTGDSKDSVHWHNIGHDLARATHLFRRPRARASCACACAARGRAPLRAPAPRRCRHRGSC